MPRRAGRPAILRPSFLIRRRAVSKGVFGGQRAWQVVAAIVYGRQFLKRTFGKTPEILISETLEPGDSMTIRTAKPVKPVKRRARS